MTYYDQEYWILLAAGHPLPDPHEQFVMDLIKQVKIWHTQGAAVLLCMDANEPMLKTLEQSRIGQKRQLCHPQDIIWGFIKCCSKTNIMNNLANQSPPRGLT